MRLQPRTIELGGQEFLIRPLTLRQVQEIEPILMASSAAPAGTKGNVASAVAIVAIAMGRDHPEAAAAIGDIEASAPDIGFAMTAVLRLGGFIEAVPGEVEAAGTEMPSGVASTVA